MSFVFRAMEEGIEMIDLPFQIRFGFGFCLQSFLIADERQTENMTGAV